MVWLSSELMFFAALFAFYFTIRGHETQLWEERTVMLNVPFALCNTIVLVVSSVWCQLGVLQAEKGIVSRPAGTSVTKVAAWGMREWYVLTYVFGSIFIAGQIYEYAHLVTEGRHPLLRRVRLGLLPGHRLPRHARHRWSHRVPAHHRAHLHHPPLLARAGHRRGRHVLLLALRRRRVDRPVHHDLRPEVTSAAPGPTTEPAPDDRNAP